MHTAPPPADPIPAAPPPPPILPPPNARSINTIEYISDNWSSTDALVRDMGVSKVVGLRKLKYLEKQGKVECSFDRWRRKAGAVVKTQKVQVPHAEKPVPNRVQSLTIKAVHFCTNEWQSTADLAAAMGVTIRQAHSKLYFQMNTKHLLELKDGKWRLKPKTNGAKHPRANGHHAPRH